MPAAASPDLARHYAAWLRERLSSVSRGEAQLLTTPFLDPFNDGIEVFVQPQGGEWLLHDDGRTIENLACLGVKTDESERRRGLIERATAGCGVRVVDGRLETLATAVNLPQRVHFLLTAILRLNDLWMSAVPHRWTDFLEMLAEFFDQHEVLYTRDVVLPGKTVEHEIDFVIPLPRRRERLIKTIADPKPQTAKVISFTWMDLQETRPDADRIVIINDVRTPDPLSGESEDEFRRVSDQTIAILRGYSSAIYRWSDRSRPEFRQLWNTNGAAA